MSRPWTQAEAEQLQQLYAQGATDAEIGKAMDRTAKAIKSRRKVLHLVSDRLLTDEQEAVIRAHYNTKPAIEIARMIGKTDRAVYSAASRMKLPRKLHHWENHLQTVKELHQNGLNDAEIGRKLNLTREQVHHIRYDRLKLPPNQEGIRRGQLRAIAAQRQTLGIKNPGDLRRLAFRKYAIQNGLPDDLRPRAVQIVYALATHGMMTRKQIAACIGMTWRGTRKSLTSNDKEGSYLAHLQARGIVIQLRRQLKTGGRGQNVSLYDLTLEWRERITSHVTQNASAS